MLGESKEDIEEMNDKGRQVGKTEFRKRLRWLIKTPPEKPEKMTISPAMAEEMLIYNVGNRPLSASTLKKFARQMSAGQWRETKHPIIFSDAEKLRDGQHRLTACVESGVAITAWVAFGDDDANFAFIDVGKPRSASDIFSINGVPNANMMAAVTRWVTMYDRGGLTGVGGGFNPLDTPEAIYQAYLEYPKLQSSAVVGGWFSKNQMPIPSVMAALHYICARKCERDANDFFERLATGIGFKSPNEPVRKLRETLVKDAANLTRMTIAAYVIQGWNATRSRKRLRTLNFSGQFPRAI